MGIHKQGAGVMWAVIKGCGTTKETKNLICVKGGGCWKAEDLKAVEMEDENADSDLEDGYWTPTGVSDTLSDDSKKTEDIFFDALSGDDAAFASATIMPTTEATLAATASKSSTTTISSATAESTTTATSTTVATTSSTASTTTSATTTAST